MLQLSVLKRVLLCTSALVTLFSTSAVLFAADKPNTTPKPVPEKTAPAKPTASPANAPHSATPGAVSSSVSHPAANGGGPSQSSKITMSNQGAGNSSAGMHAQGNSISSAHPSITPGRPMQANNPHPGIPNGNRVVTGPNSSRVLVGHDGRIRDVHDPVHGMDIHHGISGNRSVLAERADHSRVFAERGRPGFVEHPFQYHGREFERRTYVFHGRVYDRFYRGSYYHNAHLRIYVAPRYYPRAFYGWAYHPWVRPVAYRWGWAHNSWYGYYGPYFAPAPVYASPSLWLTDYMIAADLSAAYQANQEAQLQIPSVPPADSAPLTPEVKQLVADEVQRQIALENEEAQQNAQGVDSDPSSSSVARLFAQQGSPVFVAGSVMDVVDTSNNECVISDGDVLQLAVPPDANATTAMLIVLASKGGNECRKGSSVNIAITDLQEMQNHMRETVDQGMQEMQANEGQQLPPPPPSAQGQPTDATFVASAPPQDVSAAASVNTQLQVADSSDQQVATAVQVPPTSATIALGQSIGEVTSTLGSPVSIVDLGAKKIYKYSDKKITFENNVVVGMEQIN
jgi:hypothetical protein